MNAPTITHGLKQVGFGQGMIPGIIVIATLAFLLGDKRRREQVLMVLFS